MTDLFGFTAEDAKSDFFELSDGAQYRVTINSIEDKTYSNGDSVVLTCIVNESTANEEDVGKNHKLFFGANDKGRKVFYQSVAKVLFKEEDLLAGAIKRDMYIGKSLVFTAKKKGNFFSMRDTKAYDSTPNIDGMDAVSETVNNAIADNGEICF